MIKYIGIASFIISLIGGVFFIEDRYALASDVKEYKTEQARAIKDLGNQLEKARIEDKLFELEIKDPLSRSQVDRALIERYKRKLEQLK